MPGKCTVPDNRTNVPYRTVPRNRTNVPYRTKEPYQPKGVPGNRVPYFHFPLRLVRFLGTVRYGTLVRFSGTVQFRGTERYGTFVRLSGTVPWVFRYTCSAQYDSLAQCN